MMLLDKEKEILISNYVEKAEKTVEDVDFLIKNKKFFMAVNRIYYGIYYILSALSLKHDFSTSKHAQLIGWFNKNFVKESKIEKKYGKFINEAFEKRMKSDYDVSTIFSENEVDNMFEIMKKTIYEIKKLID